MWARCRRLKPPFLSLSLSSTQHKKRKVRQKCLFCIRIKILRKKESQRHFKWKCLAACCAFFLNERTGCAYSIYFWNINQIYAFCFSSLFLFLNTKAFKGGKKGKTDDETCVCWIKKIFIQIKPVSRISFLFFLHLFCFECSFLHSTLFFCDFLRLIEIQHHAIVLETIKNCRKNVLSRISKTSFIQKKMWVKREKKVDGDQ